MQSPKSSFNQNGNRGSLSPKVTHAPGRMVTTHHPNKPPNHVIRSKVLLIVHSFQTFARKLAGPNRPTEPKQLSEQLKTRNLINHNDREFHSRNEFRGEVLGRAPTNRDQYTPKTALAARRYRTCRNK
jgi:hypothetical protein